VGMAVSVSVGDGVSVKGIIVGVDV